MPRALSLPGCLLLLVASVAQAAPTQRGLVYTPPQWPQALAGDLYRPANPEAMPVVLLIHGGGWHSGRREHMEDFAEALVADGYAAFTIDYRLVPQSRFPSQLDDVREALRWLQANAATLRVDGTRIAVWGYSAGAHLAALLALAERNPSLRAVVAGGLPADLVAMRASPLVEDLLGGSYAALGEPRFRQASPRYHVDAGDPPVFLFHARWDRIVAPQQALDMQTALRAAGVPNELVWMEGRGHVLGFYFNDAAVAAAVRFLDRWLRPAP